MTAADCTQGLASTGIDLGMYAGIAAVLLAVGVVAVLLSRRSRRRATGITLIVIAATLGFGTLLTIPTAAQAAETSCPAPSTGASSPAPTPEPTATQTVTPTPTPSPTGGDGDGGNNGGGDNGGGGNGGGGSGSGGNN